MVVSDVKIEAHECTLFLKRSLARDVRVCICGCGSWDQCQTFQSCDAMRDGVRLKDGTWAEGKCRFEALFTLHRLLVSVVRWLKLYAYRRSGAAMIAGQTLRHVRG